MMDVRALRTEADYEWALKEIERYFDNQPEPGSPDGDRFDVLSTLIAAYEEGRHPIPDADPIDVLRFAIDSMGRSQAELAALLGSSGRASEILNRKRPLTLGMIQKISEAWRIPADLLAKPYKLDLAHEPEPRRYGVNVTKAVRKGAKTIADKFVKRDAKTGRFAFGAASHGVGMTTALKGRASATAKSGQHPPGKPKPRHKTK